MAIDPFSKDIGLPAPRFRSDITLITHAHRDHDHVESLGGEPFIIKGPGEYEVKNIYIEGISTFHDGVHGKERGLNTMYKIVWEGISFLHMGDFGESVMRDEIVEHTGDVDVMMMPIGGTYTIDAAQAAKIIKQIEPRIVIPMHYQIPGLKIVLGNLGAFLKEMGAAHAVAEDRLTIKKKDLLGQATTKVVVLKTA